mgnify:CR=1 FL=1
MSEGTLESSSVDVGRYVSVNGTMGWMLDRLKLENGAELKLSPAIPQP